MGGRLATRFIMCLLIAGTHLGVSPQEVYSAVALDSLDLTETPSPDRQAELAAYFKSRETLEFNPILFGDGFVTPEWWKLAKRDEPERVMGHQFAVFGTYVQFPAEIDWNGMVDRDRETVFVLNRFNYLLILREAHEKTGEAKYLRKGITLMLDWVRRCPASGRQQWAAWRPQEVGYRLNAWCQFLDYVVRRGSLHPYELCTLLRSVQEQARFLSTAVAPGQGSDGFVASAGMGIASLVFPELKGSAGWMTAAWRNFVADVQTQINADGSHEEMSPYYESAVMLSLVQISNLATQRRASVPQIILERLRMMNRYLALIRKPDGALPACGGGDRQDIRPLIEWIARWQEQDDILWLATDGKAGRKPNIPGFFAAYSGLAIFRTDWSPQTQYLLLDAGPFGTAHQHSDALQVVYSALGQEFLIDPGRYNYADGTIQSWLAGSSAHNTATVDGGPQRSVQLPNTYRAKQAINLGFQSDDGFGYASALYRDGYEVAGAQNIMHRRSIFYVPGRYAVIYDLLQGQGTHRVHLHWSFPPLKVRQIDHQTIVATGPQASLLIKTAGPPNIRASITTGLKDPPMGWISSVYNHVEPAPHATMTVRANLPARFVTLLLPFRDADKLPEASVQIETMRDEMARVTVNGKIDILSRKGLDTQPE